MSTPDRLFLPWVRRGFAGTLIGPSALATMPARPPLDVSVTIEAGENASQLMARDPIAVDGLAMMGPGDVAGFGPDVVLRSEPPDGTPDMFPNLMPSVEFGAADLPWMFTPAAPDANGNLTPWIVLVCVEEGTEATLDRDGNGRPVLRVAPPEGRPLAGWRGVLPDPEEAWAWAHVQVSGIDAATTPTADEVAAKIAGERGVIARLLCPRNLSPRRAYLCAVVPLFAAGRAAALGEDGTDETGPAWTVEDTGPIYLPVFHHWRFRTTAEGDFEALARLLEAQPLGPDIGRRAVDVQRPGLPVELGMRAVRLPAAEIPQDDGTPGTAEGALRGLPFPALTTAETPTLDIGGALRPVRMMPSPPPADPLAPALADAMRDPDDGANGHLLGPPAWGRWAAGRSTRGLDRLAPEHDWLREISTATRHRAAAGIGAEIVRRKQDALMEEIWAQFGAIEQINARLDRARLSRAASRRIAARHLELDDGLCPVGQDAPPTRIWDTIGSVADRVVSTSTSTSMTATAAEAVRGVPSGAALRRAEAAAPGVAGEIADRMKLAARVAGLLNGPEIDGRLSASDREAIEELRTAVAGIRPADIPTAFAADPDWQTARSILCAGLDPDVTLPRRTKGRLGPAVSAHQPTDDPLHPVVTWPDLPRPLYLDLKAQSQDWMLPGLDRVPQNAISLLEPDPEFVEALLAGFNHELSAEMLWRGFPTDRRGTPARTFWDRRGTASVASTADIVPIHEWGGTLGSHAPRDAAGVAGLVLLIRGDLLRRFPETMIYGLPAKARTAGSDGAFPAPELRTYGDARMPIFRGTLSPDVTFLGFDLTPEQVQANGEDGGWFFMIEGPPTEPRFGLDETLKYDAEDFGRNFGAGGSAAAPLVSYPADSAWDPIYWGDLMSDKLPGEAREAELDGLTHVPVELPDPQAPPPPDAPEARLNATLGGAAHGGVTWGRSAAHMAAITLQLDVRVAFHADALIGVARP
ncbi:hypothetical protein ILP92_06730 [Maribius pontilimi]|uniref:Uncharacterized protein n=1 Tax=Palleronia pontilimi TaxID=1964209 RepID=A0A934M9E0_9RHOB|nr:hypothetical protein [Palleronia pontilimi]MBJ3762437.1 hypothetical protein [Palleronia pontilimi]